MNRYVLPNAVRPIHTFEHEAEGSEDGPIALLHVLLQLLLRHKFKLLSWLAASTFAAALYASSIPYFYTTSATVLLKPREVTFGPTAASIASAPLDISAVESEMEVIRSGRVLATSFDSVLTFAAGTATDAERQALFDLLGETPPAPSASAEEQGPAESEAWQRTFARFVRSLDVRRVGQSYVVSISCSTNEPRLAARIANSVASAYLLQSVEAKQVQAENGAELLAARLDALTRQVGAARQAVANGVVPATAISSADAQIIGAASAPLEPSGPRRKLIIIFGAVLGMLSSTLVLALSHVFDRRIRTVADLTNVARLPCVVVPKAPGPRGWSRKPDDGEASVMQHLDTSFGLAIRDLRTVIGAALPMEPQSRGNRIALISWDAKAGCSFVALNLASFVRHGGRHVTLIETALLAAEDTPVENRTSTSLAEVLTKAIEFEDIRFVDRDGVAFLPATSRNGIGNYLADLLSPDMDRLIRHAAANGDVFLDLPSLSSTVDGRVVAQRADAVILVARAGKTRSDDVRRAIGILRDAGASLVAVVLNQA